MNTQRNWAELAKQTKEKGGISEVVYVGKGSSVHEIASIFNYSRVWAKTEGGEGIWGWFGSLDDKDFFVAIDEWEKVTGLKYSGEDNSISYYTEYSPELEALVEKIAESKGFKKNICGQEVVYFNLLENNYGTWYSPSGFNKDSQKLSLPEFLTKLYALPSKEINYTKIPGLKVTIKNGEIQAGCQKISAEMMKEIKAAADKVRNPVETLNLLPKYPMIFNKNGMTVNGNSISFEVIDELFEIIKK